MDNDIIKKFGLNDIYDKERERTINGRPIKEYCWQHHSLIDLGGDGNVIGAGIGINPNNENNENNENEDNPRLEATRANQINAILDQDKNLHYFIQFDLVAEPSKNAKEIKSKTPDNLSMQCLMKGLSQLDIKYLIASWGKCGQILLNKNYQYKAKLKKFFDKFHDSNRLYQLTTKNYTFNKSFPYPLQPTQKGQMKLKLIEKDSKDYNDYLK